MPEFELRVPGYQHTIVEAADREEARRKGYNLPGSSWTFEPNDGTDFRPEISEISEDF